MNLRKNKEKLIITPGLLRIFTILQMNFVELAEFIQNQLLENPVLELKDDKGEAESNKINVVKIQRKKQCKFLIPDIVIGKKENNYYGYVTQGNQSCLALNNYYIQLTESVSIEMETRRYLVEKIENASMIVDAVSFRKKILLKIADTIIQKNKERLENSRNFYNTISLKEASKILNINSFILSNIVYGKYIETPKGLYSLEQVFGKNIFV